MTGIIFMKALAPTPLHKEIIALNLCHGNAAE